MKMFNSAKLNSNSPKLIRIDGRRVINVIIKI